LAEPITRTLTRLDCRALEAHLLALGAEDRRLRFGAPRTDEAVREYVRAIDLARDAVFGVYDPELRLAGAAHLAHGPGHAEIGVSVLPEHRRRGIGGALLRRCAMHARNEFVRTLFMHCLSENAAMLRLARRNRMRIVTATGEADAHLELPPPDAATFATELLAERVGLFDYALKSQVLAARGLARAIAPGAA
jgi:GNAT superfamily N-acetyltransferase